MAKKDRMKQTKKKAYSKVKSKIKSKKSKKNMSQKQQGSGNKTCKCIDYDFKDSSTAKVKGNKCQNKVEEGTDFCKKHQKCLDLIQTKYLNGSELKYDPDKWNKNADVKGSHNCYTYFLNSHIKAVKDKCKDFTSKGTKSKCSKLKPQPGHYKVLTETGSLKFKNRDYTCESMIKEVQGDNPSITKITATQKCPEGSYKGALVVDPYHTYHFYRQNSNGLWSHKPGILDVTDKDASGQVIYFPHLADRNYKKEDDDGINYTDFCTYFCVPRKGHVNLNAI